MALDRQVALADLAAWVGAIEHRIVLGLEVRCAFHRHRAADVHVGGFDLALVEADRSQQVEARRSDGFRIDAERVADELFAERPLVERKLDIERGRQCLLGLGDGLVGKALGFERRRIDCWGVGERTMSNRIGFDLGDLALAIA